jgi:hypothetical protein
LAYPQLLHHHHHNLVMTDEISVIGINLGRTLTKLLVEATSAIRSSSIYNTTKGN